MNGSDLVTVRAGLTVPAAVFEVLWNLEGRGVSIRIEGDDIIVNPRELMADHERAMLRHWKTEVRTILGTVAEQLAQ